MIDATKSTPLANRRTWRVTVAGRRRVWGAYVTRIEADKVAKQLRQHGMDAQVEDPPDDTAGVP